MPTNSDLMTQLQNAAGLAKSGRMGEALHLTKAVCQAHPEHPQPWYVLSQLHMQVSAFNSAIECAKKASVLSPSEPSYLLQLGRAQAMSGKTADAFAAAERAASLHPTQPAHLDALGAIYSLCDEQERALHFFEKAVAAEPDDPRYLFNLAASQRFVGDFEAAEKTCTRVIALNPQDYRAYYVRSDLRKQTTEQNHIQELITVIESGVRNWRGNVHLHYALAKELEDVGRWDDSFQYLKKGSAIQRAHMQYNVSTDIEVIEEIIKCHTGSWFDQAGPGYSSQEPIFVFGLPRTGTTLVERIIGAHSHVFAAGELNNLPSELVRLVGEGQGQQHLSRNALVQASCTLNLAALGNAYVNGTRPRTGHTDRFIDKMPQNYLYCGLIAAALPNARLINVVRHPMDACYAMYKTIFTGAYPFSYDLDELGHYYVAYRRLIDHWQQILGERFLTISYESLVQNQEDEVRRLIDYCDLNWEDTCLDFHKSVAPSSTASAVQVRQPVYTSSIGKWKNHRAELQPLHNFLHRSGIDLGDGQRSGIF